MPRDLHLRHEPITDVFPRCEDPSRWRLDAPTVAGFERDGYVSGIDVLDAEGVELLRNRLDSLKDRMAELEGDLYEIEAAWSETPSRVVLHFLGAWMVDEVFHDLLWHPAITVPSAQLLEVDRLRFWHDQVFYKPPRHPGVVPWHQDYSYWQRTGPVRHLTVNLVLDDTEESNGCLHVVPGSHRWPLLPMVGFDDPIDTLKEHLPATCREAFEPVALPLRAGQASIHHAFTVHGSAANDADRPRRAVVVNTMGPDTRVLDGSSPLLRGVPSLPEGAVVEGDHFPILLDLT